VQGRPTVHNSETIHGALFQAGKKHHCKVALRLSERDALIRVTADDRVVIDYTRSIAAFSPSGWWYFNSDAFLGIGVAGAEVDFHAITLRLGPVNPAVALVEKLPLKKPIELLEQINLPEDVQRGHWIRKGIYSHARSQLFYDTPARANYFTAYACNCHSAAARFGVKVDGKVLYEESMKAIVSVYVELPPGAKELELTTAALGNLAFEWTCWWYPAFR
jgi:hypothetical protein